MATDTGSATTRRPKVLIAGAGVAGLEAVLALRATAGRTVDIAMLAPDREFVYRPTAVAEPFEMGEARRFDLQEICWDQHVELIDGVLARVDPGEHRIETASGEEYEYDFLILAVGTVQRDDLPGAVTFHGPGDVTWIRSILEDVEEGRATSIAFVVPAETAWTLPVYELALLTHEHLRGRDVAGVSLTVVTPEGEPLGLFGSRAAARVRELLRDRGIQLHTGCYATGTEPGALTLRPGGWLEVDRVVTLPTLDGPAIAGVPCNPHGFIHVDEHCAVPGAPDVFAAGDATTFPIKQGGLAAQQADVAVAAIEARLASREPAQTFRPEIRGLLATGRAPAYMHAERQGRGSATKAVARHPLWDPPGKIAARHLAPYLAAFGKAHLDEQRPLADRDELAGRDSEIEAEHNAAADLALAMAEADAGWGDYEAALRWLDAAEQLEVVIPSEYAEKRRRWTDERDLNPKFGGTGLRR
jgi:sulfide:quinone oxidoreductase